MAKYSKPFLTYDEQLDVLAKRGMRIGDRTEALIDLRREGYYRLSAYWYPYRIRSKDHHEGIDTPFDDLLPGISFSEVMNVCEFDRSLRRVIWPAIEAIEIAVRVAVAYQMGQHGPHAYVDPVFLAAGANAPSLTNPSNTQLQDLQHRFQRSVRSSKESFAKHFREKYDGTLPVWAVIELWDFGTLSSYYQIMRAEDRAAVAGSFGLQSARLLGSWLQSMNVLRNICAHHGRLNRRHFALAPQIPKQRTSAEFAHLYPLSDENRHSLYTVLCVLSYLTLQITNKTSWQADVHNAMAHIGNLPLCDLRHYGFPEDWQTQDLWAN